MDSLSNKDVSIGTFVLGQTNRGIPRTCLGDANTGELSLILLNAAVDSMRTRLFSRHNYYTCSFQELQERGKGDHVY